MSRMRWPMMAALRCYGCDGPYVDFGAVESENSRERSGGCGCRGSRRVAATPGTGNINSGTRNLSLIAAISEAFHHLFSKLLGEVHETLVRR